jgi:pimeloyl-ACP methyl ester carboxylesterase
MSAVFPFSMALLSLKSLLVCQRFLPRSVMTTPRLLDVQCASPAGLHNMAYTEWGAPDNPRVLICVHGLTRLSRDFDRLAQVLSDRYRVVCPDVVGRGRSDWLRNPLLYAVPQYVADMVTLIARLNVPQVHWLGTSMGGLIGLSLAGLENSPIARLVINDVGPAIDAAALVRIGEYLGQPVRFATVDEAVDYVARVAAPFGLKSRDDWRAITEPGLRRDGEGWTLHYDPAIAAPFRAASAELAASGEALLWQLYDRVACPTLLVRGAESDLLTRATAQRMTERGPRARLVEIAGVGHAPMFMDASQIGIVCDFLFEG